MKEEGQHIMSFENEIEQQNNKIKWVHKNVLYKCLGSSGHTFTDLSSEPQRIRTKLKATNFKDDA